MEVVHVLHMNGGIGDTSYANNSLLQQKVISMTKPITEEAIVNHYSNSLSERLVIADLGCSSGPNTLFVVSELVKTVHHVCRNLGRQSPEFQVFLNDLPGNDFNSIFKSLPSFQEKLRDQMGAGFGPCFFTGVPGSFYGRLFPSKSLHFVHSSYSLQWLSQGLIEEEKMDTFNIPQYTPCPSEVQSEVIKEGSFTINRLKVSQVNWNAYYSDFSPSDALSDGGYNVAKCMRSVDEPLLVSHFGEGIIEELFRRYREIIADRMSKEKTEFINVIISMTKKG